MPAIRFAFPGFHVSGACCVVCVVQRRLRRPGSSGGTARNPSNVNGAFGHFACNLPDILCAWLACGLFFRLPQLLVCEYGSDVHGLLTERMLFCVSRSMLGWVRNRHLAVALADELIDEYLYAVGRSL
jgi:hypothetical protein